MDIKANAQDSPERVLASLSAETLDSLAELVVAKLTAKNGGTCFPSRLSRVRIPSPAPVNFKICQIRQNILYPDTLPNESKRRFFPGLSGKQINYEIY